MLNRCSLWLFFLALGALVSLRAQTPAPAPAAPAAAAPNFQPGRIQAAKVIGTVKIKVDGQLKDLANGDLVPQTATVSTAANSSAVLVFENGATTQLGPATELVVEQFLMDPFKDAALNMAALTAEPTVSKTRLHLNHGELIGHVQKLKHDQGSTFTVETPVGAAGIRGTTFRIVFVPNGTGSAFNFQLSTVEGTVAFTQPGAGGTTTTTTTTAGQGTTTTNANGTTTTTTNNNGTTQSTTTGAGTTTSATGTTASVTAGVPVTQGQEIVINVDVSVNPTTGAVTVTTLPPPVTATTAINPTTNAFVTQQAVDIATTAAAVTFAQNTQVQSATGSGNSGGSTNGTTGDNSGQNQNQQGQNQQGQNQTNPNSGTSTTPPSGTTSGPRVTTGDGQSGG